tara:strand:+ start:8690 stop:9253 length:564 start_codon:yes stop_codon:yes gene_type:complete
MPEVRRPSCSLCDSFIVFCLDDDFGQWHCLNCDSGLFKTKRTTTKYSYFMSLEERQKETKEFNETFTSMGHIKGEIVMKKVDEKFAYAPAIQIGTREVQLARALERWMDEIGLGSIEEMATRLSFLEYYYERTQEMGLKDVMGRSPQEAEDFANSMPVNGMPWIANREERPYGASLKRQKEINESVD